MIEIIAFFIRSLFNWLLRGPLYVVATEDEISKLVSFELFLIGEWNNFSIILALGLFDFDAVFATAI